MAKINVTLLTLLVDVVTDIGGTDIWNRDIESQFYFVFDTILQFLPETKNAKMETIIFSETSIVSWLDGWWLVLKMKMWLMFWLFW